MIIPINQTSNGVEREVGAVRVEVIDGEYTVEFYLIPDFMLDKKVKADLAKELISLSRKRFDGFSLG